MITWVEEVRVVAMEIIKSKPNQVWCTIECIKHHEDHKHESLCLNPSIFLDFTCNLRHELELDLWEPKKFCKEKL